MNEQSTQCGQNRNGVKAALRLALEMVQNKMYAHAEMYLKEALAQPAVAEQHKQRSVSEHLEPVAYIEHHKGGDNLEWDDPGGKRTPLYTTPYVATPRPQRSEASKPLTTEQIWEIAKNLEDASWRQIVDAIEAAHGIRPADLKE